MSIEEDKVVKGGWNKKPITKRPAPPKGQGIRGKSKICIILDDVNFMNTTIIDKGDVT